MWLKANGGLVEAHIGVLTTEQYACKVLDLVPHKWYMGAGLHVVSL